MYRRKIIGVFGADKPLGSEVCQRVLGLGRDYGVFAFTHTGRQAQELASQWKHERSMGRFEVAPSGTTSEELVSLLGLMPEEIRFSGLIFVACNRQGLNISRSAQNVAMTLGLRMKRESRFVLVCADSGVSPVSGRDLIEGASQVLLEQRKGVIADLLVTWGSVDLAADRIMGLLSETGPAVMKVL